jgi:hypothetical protein
MKIIPLTPSMSLRSAMNAEAKIALRETRSHLAPGLKNPEEAEVTSREIYSGRNPKVLPIMLIRYFGDSLCANR